MKTTIVALSAAASLLGPVALAQTANDQAQADYQAKQAQYQDKQAQYQDQKEQYNERQAQYQDQKHEYRHEMARWAAGQPWPERYWGDHYVVSDWSVVHLRDPGEGYRWYRDDDGNYVRVAVGTHVIEEVHVR
jgi:Ni/Co efflux regulator RcnB